MKKKIFSFFLFLIIIIIIVFLFLKFYKKSENLPINEQTKNFKISKIIYYSSANAISNTTSFQNPEWNLRVYQYTDIAFYLKRLDSNSYITDVNLKNFQTEHQNSKIYYINPKNIGNSDLNEDNVIENDLKYTVINSNNFEDEQNYNIPIFFQDCSNPITFRIVTELSNNYTVPKESTLLYNGSIIKELGLGIYNLNKNISFDIEIKTKQGDIRNKNVLLEIPYESKVGSILDGDFKIESNSNIEF